MNAEIITIGDEILIGQITDTNSAWISRELNLIGMNVIRITSVPDNKSRIITALEESGKRADVIIMTGGLGPTKDDITKISLAEFFNTDLVFDKNVFENINKLLSPRGIHINEQNRKQAEIPEGCVVINNPNGTAPGLWFEKNNKIYVSVPGVPFEMERLLKEQILPEIKKRFNDSFILHKNIMTYGTFEAHLAEILSVYEQELPKDVKLAYLPSAGIIRLRLSISGGNREGLNDIMDKQLKKLQRIIPNYIFGYDNDSMENVTGRLLKENKFTLSTAESCTGGNIAHKITSVPGSSEYYTGSVIAYSNRIKQDVLNVNPDNIIKYGAVSKTVVEEMAKGIRQLFNTDTAIATSGIAGPDGGTTEKPVGTTWIAVICKDKKLVKKYQFGNTRARNIHRASLTALNTLRKLLINSVS